LNDPWAYGTDVGYLRGLVDYWRDGFDWRKEEAALNAFPQFVVPIDGIDLHYLHVEGKGRGPDAVAFCCTAGRVLYSNSWTSSRVSPIRRASVAIPATLSR